MEHMDILLHARYCKFLFSCTWQTLIMCDDVWKKVSNSQLYKSDASFKTINEFEKANILTANFIRKGWEEICFR